MKLANKDEGIIPSSKCFTSLWIFVCILFLTIHVNLGMNEAKNVDLFFFPFSFFFFSFFLGGGGCGGGLFKRKLDCWHVLEQ